MASLVQSKVGSGSTFTFDTTATAGNLLVGVFGHRGTIQADPSASGWNVDAHQGFREGDTSTRRTLAVVSKISDGSETSVDIGGTWGRNIGLEFGFAAAARTAYLVSKSIPQTQENVSRPAGRLTARTPGLLLAVVVIRDDGGGSPASHAITESFLDMVVSSDSGIHVATAWRDAPFGDAQRSGEWSWSGGPQHHGSLLALYETTETFEISGTVSDGGGVEGAHVLVVATDAGFTHAVARQAVTDSFGDYAVDVPKGLVAHALVAHDDGEDLHTAEAAPFLEE